MYACMYICTFCCLTSFLLESFEKYFEKIPDKTKLSTFDIEINLVLLKTEEVHNEQDDFDDHYYLERSGLRNTKDLYYESII